MENRDHETITIIKVIVVFTEEEWRMLEARSNVGGGSTSEYIHHIVMRSLRRKGRTKKEIKT